MQDENFSPMDKSKECGSYQRLRQTSEAENKPAAHKTRTWKSKDIEKMRKFRGFEVPSLGGQ